MKKFYSSLSKSKKIIFLILTLLPLIFLSGFVGFMLGMYAINFIPDVCSTKGIVTGCRNPFEFMGFVGWEGTSFLGLLIGVVVPLTVYLFFIIKWKLKK